jgi:ABC-type transport system substrate-binding protein
MIAFFLTIPMRRIIPTGTITLRSWLNAINVRRAPNSDCCFDVRDTLYGIDATLQVRRQLIEAEEVWPDGLTWTFQLRPGLKFHDGERVTAKDAVASVNRWAARQPRCKEVDT